MEDVFELYWKHFRPQLATWWDKLDSDDVAWVNGKRENLVTLLANKYGCPQVECENMIRQRIDAFEQRHRNKLGSFKQKQRQFAAPVPLNHPTAVIPFRNPEVSTNESERPTANANAIGH